MGEVGGGLFPAGRFIGGQCSFVCAIQRRGGGFSANLGGGECTNEEVRSSNKSQFLLGGSVEALLLQRVDFLLG